LRIFSHSTLVAYWKKHPDAEAPLRAWYKEAKRAAWRGPADVRASYRSADFVGSNRVIFNVAGNKYRLVAWVEYEFFGAYVRFVGSHAEYDRIDVTKV